MSGNKNIDISPETGQSNISDSNIALHSDDVSSIAGSIQSSKANTRVSTTSERQIKFERAQKCLENAALVSKRIKEHRKATAELLGRPFEDDEDGDTASEMASTVSERTGYSVATDTSTTLSVQEALNIPGISESLANTLKQKEILMEKIKQYKEISKRPLSSKITKTVIRKDSTSESALDLKKSTDNKDVKQLISTIQDKENALSVMQVKMKAMETTILDLQEKISEKDQIIQAKNKATTIISDSLSKKERDTLTLLEDTRQQMTKMQENFAAMEAEWKEEREKLLQEALNKDEKICNLEEANTILENARFEISIAHGKLAEEIQQKNQEITNLQEKIQELSQVPSSTTEPSSTTREEEEAESEKGSKEVEDMVELTKKIELLEQLNCQIRQTNKELESKLAATSSETKSSTSSPSKKASPLPTRKGGRNTAAKMKSPWSNLSTESLQDTEKKANKGETVKLDAVVQSLNKDLLEKEYTISQKDTLISKLKAAIEEQEIIINELKLKHPIKTEPETLEMGTNTDDVVSQEHRNVEEPTLENIDESPIEELREKLKSSLFQISELNKEIDVANKNMIKVKSSHKLKIKQMQKTIENFSKVSDSNAEIIKLNEDLNQLTQKVAELEEEKGNLQLHLVDYDSGRLTDSDIYKKMIEMENLAESRLKAISVLETQKFDLVQELHVLQQKNDEMEDRLADMTQSQSEQVCTEMKSVQLEEQIDQLLASKQELQNIIERLNLDKEKLNNTIKSLEDERDEIMQKLENYIQENMELHDKLDKMSAEKVSSAESIEIVESLTTQEKLELEEYNKGLVDKIDEHQEQPGARETPENIEKIVEQSEELNKKIECFNQERQEVLEKMSLITEENKMLQIKISELNEQCDSLKRDIGQLNDEKQELKNLNEDIVKQVEELKRERLEVFKESVELRKPSSLEDATEIMSTEAQTDDKTAGEKSNKAVKSVKQLTKEILKLKNTIKEREEEIADCQMRILSLEEQEQKHKELLQSNASYEAKLKTLLEENSLLKQDLDSNKKETQNDEQVIKLRQDNELLQQEIHKIHQEYNLAINNRDAKTYELENLLQDYEKQILNYGNNLQQKDKEISEYINQITKLNDVSQKLKSTIELLEEEKLKDQNAEIIKSLNKQILAYQKKLAETEDKVRVYEEEMSQMKSAKTVLENKYNDIENELKKTQDMLTEKLNTLQELQKVQSTHTEEKTIINNQLKERDEEIHEVKLQLRKESIENEKLREALAIEKSSALQLLQELNQMREEISEKVQSSDQVSQEIHELKENLNNLKTENNEMHLRIETSENKNKDLLEKLKKFAVSIKKKNAMYTELENLYHESQTQLGDRNQQIEQLTIQVETLPSLQEKLKYAEEALNDLKSQKLSLEQQTSSDILLLQSENKTLQNNITRITEVSNQELQTVREERDNLVARLEFLNNKIGAYEIDQKNNTNFLTKITSLESDNSQKQLLITDLQNQIESYKQQFSQVQFGHDAKVQERDMYIENLETEINKYKNRINRLEESISAMEDRRNLLERKADYLDTQLQEKHKAYNEYTVQEDELIGRLAVLMDHDRVVEKQLNDIDSENKELHYKIQHLNDENQRLTKYVSDVQEQYNVLLDKAQRTDSAESEVNRCHLELTELKTQMKKITQDYQSLLTDKKQMLEELEAEFNVQIEGALKEKKLLSEKYEKTNDHVTQLELKLQEYRTNIDNLNINVEELSRLNHELMEKQNNEQVQSPDYTEQYVREINNLQSIVNSKNEQVLELQNNIQQLQGNYNSLASQLEHDYNEHNLKTSEYLRQIEDLQRKISTLSEENYKLHDVIAEKEEKIRHLTEKSKVVFEMNIPKTEGMFITSTMEPVSMEGKGCDMASLESQIVCETDEPIVQPKIVSHSMQGQGTVTPDGVLEQTIVPKKTYDCFKGDQPSSEVSDPFNSDEGWGLGEADESGALLPGYSNFIAQIEELKSENENLRSNLNASSVKLQKALKKLKELKINNDMLSNELKISKEISQSTLLDSAIEDELANNVKDLEKKINELSSELSKEKREKEALRKQNEVFHNANDKLTEIKEKLDNEIELWKYKFKEVNDKLSTHEWGSSSTPDHKPLTATDLEVTPDVNRLRDEILSFEKENDELHTMNEQLTADNDHLTIQLSDLKEQIINLQSQNINTKDYDTIHQELLHVESKCQDLQLQNDSLQEKIMILETKNDELEQAKQKIELEYVNAKNEFELHCKTLHDKYSNLLQELQIAKSKILDDQTDRAEEYDNLLEKYNYLDGYCNDLKTQLNLSYEKNTALEHFELQNKDLLDTIQSRDEELSNLRDELTQLQTSMKNITELQRSDVAEDTSAHTHENLEEMKILITKLETENKELIAKIEQKDLELTEFNSKLSNLNSENDNLLSTVTELRSSLTSAVDQRGFEIAELWKQHLSQRESEFQRIEQELRSELNLSVSKYEQLLDSVQSSTQEETNKLVMETQIDALQNKLKDAEEHVRDIQEKYSELMNQCDMMRSEMEDEKVMYENKLMGQQEEYEKQLKELKEQNNDNSHDYQQSFENLQRDLASSRSEKDELNRQINDLAMTVEDSEEKILELTNELRRKDMEVHNKTHEYSVALSQKNEEFENVRQQLLDYEKKVEDIGFEKESELAVLRLKMHEKTEYYENERKVLESDRESLAEALNTKIVECTNLNRIITELNKALEENSLKSAEMQAALENQELDIVTLRDEVTSLQDALRASSSRVEKHVTFASDTKPGSSPEHVEYSREMLDAVPRAELDLALYIIHQRDVRCEELTMELTQLLEERDTLQLRLSDSLRSYEELKFKCKSAGMDTSLDVTTETVSELPSFSVEREFVETHRGQTSRSSSVSDPDGDKPKLQAKLSELRTVRQSRDVTLRHDSERRQLGLRLLQRDVANLPPEAVEQLAQAHHTLSRDSQSTSTVLLNWLRGKSTPKVVQDM